METYLKIRLDMFIAIITIKTVLQRKDGLYPTQNYNLQNITRQPYLVQLIHTCTTINVMINLHGRFFLMSIRAFANQL